MHENNFEKQVQEKMDQLGFDPSDAVWAAVNKEINKDKKRRSPFFMLFFLSGLLLAGGGVYFGMIKNSSPKVVANTQQKGKIEQPEGKNQKSNQLESSLNGKPIIDSIQKTPLNIKKRQNKDGMVFKSANENQRSAQKEDFSGSKGNSPESNLIVTESGKDNVEGKNQALTKTEPEKSGNNKIDSSVKTPIIIAKNMMAKDSLSANKTAKKDEKKATSSKWKFGLNAGAGMSSINQSLFKQSNVTGLYYNPANANNANGAAAPVPVSSEINPGFSFNAGVFVSRNLSKRISVSAGLNYHYYSTRVNTGYAVDSSIFVSYSPNNSGNSTLPGAYAINGYYPNGSNQSYTNSYHFIELPVTADFQLNKSSKLPVFWEAGFSVSYLVNSNALHFDPNGNLYYQNAQLFNKVQLNGATAIMIGFPVNKTQLQIGPLLQYGLTGLLKTESGNPQHLLYTGLKISIIPGKK
ncbi:MAG TPA: outer membrane beta-barrel protein [Puia sp.]|nr:outer membrane beta-barrel protein [Puia sp.]